jgi:glycolate oxidase FAD binding subunit
MRVANGRDAHRDDARPPHANGAPYSDMLADLTEHVARAHATRTPLRIRGGGTWLHAGRPCNGEPLDLRALSGVIDYEPADLTLTAYAGTTLRELDRITAAEGQWLALDPHAAPEATIGATVATASDGPLASTFGRMRDLVLGLECITGIGERVRAGGRVVKNVAGFDLVRLHTGAWGTLGVITEVTMRLRARPEQDRLFVICSDDRDALERRLAPLADLAISPFALELVNAPLATALGLEPRLALLVRLGGNAERVAAQRTALDALGDVHEVGLDTLSALAAADSTEHLVARITHDRSRFSDTWRHVTEFCDAHALWQPRLRGSVRRGLVRVSMPLDQAHPPRIGDWAAFVRTIAPFGAHVTWEQLPAEAWPHVPCAVADTISTGLRRALDPAHILNRGLLGESLSPNSTIVPGSEARSA